MPTKRMSISVLAAAIGLGLTLGTVNAVLGREDPGAKAGSSPTAGGGGTTPPSAPGSTPPSKRPTAGSADLSPTGGSAGGDRLSEENLIRERLYYDVTGHSFTKVNPPAGQKLSPCTGDRIFADSLPKDTTVLGSMLVGEDGREVVHQAAQIGSADQAKGAAEEIATLVASCPGTSGGDLGYGDLVTLESTAKREVFYLPASDSGKAFGGYIVIQAGNRVAAVNVADDLPEKKVAALARAIAGITAD